LTTDDVSIRFSVTLGL